MQKSKSTPEIKNTFHGLISRLDITEERITEFKDMLLGTSS